MLVAISWCSITLTHVTNRHGGAAWTLPPVQPVVESSPPGPSQSLSFAAIQQLQLNQGFASANDKRSLLEIQEEEQARQAENDFLKWWAVEEERVKMEARDPSLSQGGQGKGPRKAKGPKIASTKNTTPGAAAGSTGIGGQPEGTPPRRNTRRQAYPISQGDRPKPNTTS
jgi:inhibitor of Bruton tyrosine kinase